MAAWALVGISCGLPTQAQADVHDDVAQALRSRQYIQAQQLIERHLQRHPSDPQMRLFSSRLAEARGQMALAQQQLEALVLEFPELPEPHNNLAVHYARQGRLDEAFGSLARALKARPTDLTALDNLGRLHMSMAESAYRRASALPQAPAQSLIMADAMAKWLQTPPTE